MNPAKFGRFGTSHQISWDWRAAANFIGGGSGSALLLFATLTTYPASPPLWAVLAGLALIGAGLACVWAEIGRPWRAFNVLFHPQTSWMTREAYVAALIFLLSVAALASGLALLAHAAGAAALLFLYCQGRILKAARGIPAWREPAVVRLIVATGLVEGCALLVVLQSVFAAPRTEMLGALMVLVLLRGAAWLLYRGRLLASDAPQSTRRALAPAQLGLLLAGGALPLLAGGAGLALPQTSAFGVLAAIAALLPGWHFKFLLVTRAAQVQGYALGNKLRRGHPLAQAR